jgi:transcriptional antiterminator NusG
MEDKKLERQWYVLHTKSRFENVVNEGLLKKQIEVFLPKITVRSKRRDRRAMIRIPLFPGYVFVKTDLHPHHHLEIVKTAGAVRLIGNRQGPIAVAEETIDSLQIMISSGVRASDGSCRNLRALRRKGPRHCKCRSPRAVCRRGSQRGGY